MTKAKTTDDGKTMSQVTWETVNRELAKDKNQAVTAICKRYGLNPKLYYNIKNRIASGGKPRFKKTSEKEPAKRKYARHVVETTNAPSVASTPVMLVMGTPDQIRQVMAQGGVL